MFKFCQMQAPTNVNRSASRVQEILIK